MESGASSAGVNGVPSVGRARYTLRMAIPLTGAPFEIKVDDVVRTHRDVRDGTVIHCAG